MSKQNKKIAFVIIACTYWLCVIIVCAAVYIGECVDTLNRTMQRQYPIQQKTYEYHIDGAGDIEVYPDYLKERIKDL